MKNYEAIVNGFFDEFENKTKGVLILRKVFRIFMMALIAWFFIGAMLAEALESEPMVYSVLAALVMFIIGLFFIRPKVRDKVEDKIDEENLKFFDEVYMPILAAELDANVGGETCSTILGRKICIDGEINGCPYTLREERDTVIEEKLSLTHGATTTVNERRYPMMISMKSKYPTAEKIVLNSFSDPIEGLSVGRKVTMDSKRFRFDVRCNDSVEAYKVLTADTMERITRWSDICNVQGVELKNNEIVAHSRTNLINLDYNPLLSKSVKRNRKNFTADFIVKEVSESVDGVRKFITNVPFADFSRN